MRLLLLTAFICMSVLSTAQRVGINNTNPHASAALDISATDKGVLIPRLTKAGRLAISSPANGLMVYQSGPDSMGFYYYHSNWHYLNYDSMLPPTAMVLSATANNARLQNNNFSFKGKLNMPGAIITAEMPVASNIWQAIDSTVNAYPVNGAADLFSTWADSVYYLAGGAEAGSTGIDFYKFNAVTGRWSIAYSSGLKMTTGAAQARVGNKWVFWGGYYNPGNNQATAAYIFDVATNSFTTSSLPNDSSRRSLMAVAVGNNVYFWGGAGILTYPYSYSTGYYYNVVNNTWTAMNAGGAPAGRMNAGAVAAGANIVIWGGYNPNGGGLLANGGMYNTTTNTWTTLSSTNAPPASVDPAMAYYNGNVYIIAGNQAKMLNIATNTWTTLAPPPYNFTGQKFAYDGNGKIFVFGGGRYFFPTNPNANGYVYDIANNSYSLLTAPGAPAARAGHTICVNNNGTWLVWGGSPVAGSVIPPAEQCFKSGALFYLNASNVLVTTPLGDLFLYEKK